MFEGVCKALEISNDWTVVVCTESEHFNKLKVSVRLFLTVFTHGSPQYKLLKSNYLFPDDVQPIT